MTFSIVLSDELQWTTRPHEPGEPARHVAELQGLVGFEGTRANVSRYERGELLQRVDEILGAVSHPDFRQEDPAPGRERFYRELPGDLKAGSWSS